MSRLGKIPVVLPAGTSAVLNKNVLSVTGPKGKLEQAIHQLVNVVVEEGQILVSVNDKEDRQQRAFWGLFHKLVSNMVIGVSQGYEKKLEINGVGYRASLSGQKLTMNLGFSHPVDFILPEGIKGQVEGNVITVAGIDKQLVGEIAAQIRRKKKPEPYKGKGIKYIDEVIRRKAGKTSAK
ncbi:MAG TPA: 50S ribosomal protein L6 [bacterium]|nr:50S ribosomal protein L6 [bacterium]